MKDAKKVNIHQQTITITNINNEKLKENLKLRFENMPYYNDLLIYISTLEKQNVPTDIMYYNLNTVEIDVCKRLFKLINFFKKRETRGLYSCQENLIFLPSDFKNLELYHELNHMSSTIVSKTGTIYCGLEQTNKNKEKIGTGLTEGYTELLNQRFFLGKEHPFLTYDVETLRIVYIIEKIVGKDLMQECYYRADLKSVVNEMMKYADILDIYQFLIDLDDIYEGKSKNIHEFLIKILIKKYKESNDLEYELAYYIYLFKNDISKEYLKALLEELLYENQIKKIIEEEQTINKILIQNFK